LIDAAILFFLKHLLHFLGNSTLVMNPDQRVLCILAKSFYKDLDKIGRVSYIIEEDRGKLIISNRR
jgi:hypothetical protein